MCFFNREQSHTFGKKTSQKYFTNVWENQSDKGPPLGAELPSKPNTCKESKLMVTHRGPKPVANTVLPNHHQPARDNGRLVTDNRSSNVKKTRKFYTMMFRLTTSVSLKYSYYD